MALWNTMTSPASTETGKIGSGSGRGTAPIHSQIHIPVADVVDEVQSRTPESVAIPALFLCRIHLIGIT